MRMANLLISFIQFLLGLVVGLLGLRALLKLFGASTAAPFVNWLYDVTLPLLAPFQGAFPAPKLQGGYVIEFTALFAILIYSLAAYLLVELISQAELITLRRKKDTLIRK